DFLVLARYMLVLSAEFLKSYGKDIINIHHSFLPSFKGSGPYRQAYARGVKVIGATAHFVAEDLDEGAIISQVVEPVSHRDDANALMRKGKNLEKRALSGAIACYLDYRIIKYQNKTIVF
ncbi:MAG: formyltransferase family protein, partial [Candidatus Omnitrophica bacterium]|nr:formyltransferase family protein [Candidatus Omnitrophota bacterium]